MSSRPTSGLRTHVPKNRDLYDEFLCDLCRKEASGEGDMTYTLRKMCTRQLIFLHICETCENDRHVLYMDEKATRMKIHSGDYKGTYEIQEYE